MNPAVSTQLPANKGEISKLTGQILDLQFQIQSSASVAPRKQNYISKLKDKIDDLERRSRRSNVLLCAISDGNLKEFWDAVQKVVTDFCQSQLQLTVTSIAGAHHLGHFSPDRTRPIIAKVFDDKEVGAIVSGGSRLKGTPYGLPRDFSRPVHDKRAKLLKFSKTK